MGRKTKYHRIEAGGNPENRDIGKVFLLTEMAASKAERWAMRALIALMKSGMKISDDEKKMGLSTMAEKGFETLQGVMLDPKDVEPLMDELMSCVQFYDEHTKISRGLFEEDIEEVMTRVELKKEVFYLHTGFLRAAGIQKSPARAAQSGSDSTQSSITRTSPGSSAAPYPPDSRRSPSSTQL